MSKLALILDKSEAYIKYQRDKVLDNWNPEAKDHIFSEVEKLSECGGSTLFGPAPIPIIILNTPTEIKELVKDLEEYSEKNWLNSVFENGLIIISSANRNSTKKLEKLVKDFSGEVYAAASGKNSLTLTERIVSEINFNTSTRDFLVSYLGDNYEAAIPIIRTLSEHSKSVQEKISIEDLYIRLPQPPGSVPPWEVENYLYRGDLTKAIETLRRVNTHSSFLVVLSVLFNKIKLTYRIAGLKAIGNPSIQEISGILQVSNNYPLKLAYQNATKYGIDKMTKLVMLLESTDRKVKGGSSVDNMALMEVMLIEFSQILKS